MKERRAFNTVGVKNERGISVENIRGYVADSRYDVEMKLHIQSQPLKKFMKRIEHDIIGVPRVSKEKMHRKMMSQMPSVGHSVMMKNMSYMKQLEAKHRSNTLITKKPSKAMVIVEEPTKEEEKKKTSLSPHRRTKEESDERF